MARKKLLILLGSVCLALMLVTVACATPTPTSTPATHEIVKLTQMTSPFGTGSYALSFAAEQISGEYHPWLKVTALESPGTMYEFNMISSEPSLWPNTLFSAGPGDLVLASKGLPPFEEPLQGFRYTFNYCAVTSFFVTLDPNIKTVNDLKGKHVAIGRRSQAFWGQCGIGPFIETGLGWDLEKDIRLEWIGTGPGATALLDGTLDACIQGGYFGIADGQPVNILPSTPLEELMASGRDIYYISMPEEATEKVYTEASYQSFPTCIPAGTLQQQTEDLLGFSITAGNCVHRTAPEEVIKEYTKLWFEYYAKFGDYHALGKILTPELLAHTTWLFEDPQTMIHPGALAAYQEYADEHPDMAKIWREHGLID